MLTVKTKEQKKTNKTSDLCTWECYKSNSNRKNKCHHYSHTRVRTHAVENGTNNVNCTSVIKFWDKITCHHNCSAPWLFYIWLGPIPTLNQLLKINGATPIVTTQESLELLNLVRNHTCAPATKTAAHLLFNYSIDFNGYEFSSSTWHSSTIFSPPVWLVGDHLKAIKFLLLVLQFADTVYWKTPTTWNMKFWWKTNTLLNSLGAGGDGK